MQPLLDRVLIAPKKEEITTSAGGILLSASKVYSEGVVKAVGPGKKDEPMMLEAGDQVIYPKNAGDVLEDNLFLNQELIIATNNDGVLQPLFDWIAVEVVKTGEVKNAAGIITIESKTIKEGIVLATGNGRNGEPMMVEVNETVFFPYNAGMEILNTLFIYQRDIIGIEKAEKEGGED